MSAHIAVFGRLGKDPSTRETSTGTPMAFGSMVANLDREDMARGSWFQVIAFGKTVDQLAALRKGDMLTACGRLQSSTWTAKDGQERTNLEVVADQIVCARKPKKRPADKPTAQPAADPAEPAAEPVLDDEIPF